MWYNRPALLQHMHRHEIGLLLGQNLSRAHRSHNFLLVLKAFKRAEIDDTIGQGRDVLHEGEARLAKRGIVDHDEHVCKEAIDGIAQVSA